MLSFMVFGQLNEPILIAPFNTLCERVALVGAKFARFAAKLEEPTYKCRIIFRKIPCKIISTSLCRP
jgi:hypothetical protein